MMVETSTTVGLGPLRRRVENLLLERGHTTKWLYERIGMSKVGYRQMWDAGSIKVTTLQRMSLVLGLSVGELLGEVVPGMVNEPAATYAKPKYLEERVAELEEQVKQLRHDLRRKG